MTAEKKTRLHVPDILKLHKRGSRLVMVTAYDFTFARLLDGTSVELLLVGDSLSATVQGVDTTLPVTLDEMVYHSRLVVRGSTRPMVVADMPFLSYQTGARDALLAAGRLIKETGVGAVKLEGGARFARTVKVITRSGIPVMGHLGLLPQSYHQMGGYKVQGQSAEEAQRLLDDAKKLEDAGTFAIVLEGIPSSVAETITSALHIPTIGIGAGSSCSGQVLVLHDLLGLNADDSRPAPKFVKRYANLGEEIKRAVQTYAEEVRTGVYPDKAHSY
ncbi:MAG: 3-methyl-2-oxobutanoate hydroxymethyltransferase [Bdellovibrionota bacterium]